MKTDDARTLVKSVYEARRARNFEAMAALLHKDFEFVIEGLGVEDPAAVPVRTKGLGEFLAILPKMAEDWRWREVRWRDLIVEGDRAAARYTLDLVYAPLDHAWATEVVDFIRIADGKIAEVVEYIDTATASGLIAKAQEAG